MYTESKTLILKDSLKKFHERKVRTCMLDGWISQYYSLITPKQRKTTVVEENNFIVIPIVNKEMSHISLSTTISKLLCLFILLCEVTLTNAFVSVSQPYTISISTFRSTSPSTSTSTSRLTSSILFATKQKLTFAQKKKKRGRKQKTSIHLPKQRIADDIQPDKWDKTSPVTTTTSTSSTSVESKDEKEVKSEAAALIETQRKSIAMLSHVRERLEALPISSIQKVLSDDSRSEEQYYYYIQDDFLLNQDQMNEMMNESRYLFDNNKLTLVEVGSGEYTAPLTGGDTYADSPRCVEFVASMTRHLPPLLNNPPINDNDDTDKKMGSMISSNFVLDETASMMNVMAFDRRSKLASFELLIAGAEKEDKNMDTDAMEDDNVLMRPFEYVTGGDVNDARKVTAIYFMTSHKWDPTTCGGGITIQKDSGETVVVEAKQNRLVLFRSDKCLRMRNIWKGKDEEGMDFAGCLVTHLVRKG